MDEVKETKEQHYDKAVSLAKDDRWDDAVAYMVENMGFDAQSAHEILGLRMGTWTPRETLDDGSVIIKN